MERPVILVTGASRGLGRGVALTLASEGYDVVVHYASNRAAADATLADCRAAAKDPSQRFIAISAQLSDPAERKALMEQTLSQMGHLDALINNAGIAPRERADLPEAKEEIFDEVLSVNLKGPYFLSQLAARYWLANSGKCRLAGDYKMVFVTSISADTVSTNRGEYCISKAGLAMAAQLWAARLANEGVQVIELRPGIMATDMTAGVKDKYDALIATGLIPQFRWGKPEDVGLAVRGICRGDFPYSTGDVIYLDGGMHLRRL